MYRITGKEAFGLMEAYQAVYQPELREEQIWEGVENWVNSLLEEGYDLSDYTWEDMYESYRGTSGQEPTAMGTIEPKFGVDKTGIKPLTTFTKPAALTPMDQFAKANPRLAAAQAEKDRIRGTSQTDNPLMKDMRDRMPMTPSVQSPTLAKDLGGVKGLGNQSLLNNPNANKSPEISAPNPVKANVPGFALGGKDPRASTPTPEFGTSSTIKPITKFVSAPGDLKPGIRDLLNRNPAPKPMDAFTAGGGAAKMTKSGMTRDQVIAQGNKNNARLPPRGVQLTHIDLFDLVKGHLLDEGYADTYEAAEVIMVNMSEDWRQSIIERKYDPDEKLPSGRTPDQNMSRAQMNLGARYMTEPSPSRFADRRLDTTRSSSLGRGRKNKDIQDVIRSGKDPRNATIISNLDGKEIQNVDLRKQGRPGVTPEERDSRTVRDNEKSAHTQGGLRAHQTREGGYRKKKKIR